MPATEIDSEMEPELEEVFDRAEKALAMTRRYTAYAGGAAFIPVPGVDLAAIAALQVKLVRDLSVLYGVKFTANAGKTAVTALLSTIVPVSAGVSAASLMKAIPVVGTVLGIASAPAFAAAATYAVGRTFTMHFETGGTLLTFDADKMREFFQKEYQTASKASSTSESTSSASAAKASAAKPSAAAAKAS